MIPSSIADRISTMKVRTSYKSVHTYLSPEEKAAINAYTDDQFYNLNKFLRGERFPAAHEEALKEISTLLSKALQNFTPKYTATAHRGTCLPENVIDQYKDALKNKTTITHSYFTSSSSNAAVAEKVVEKPCKNITERKVLFNITSRNGNFVKELSQYETEDEVLFDKHTNFETTSINDTSDIVYIHLKEV
jgi:hypothetical protein